MIYVEKYEMIYRAKIYIFLVIEEFFFTILIVEAQRKTPLEFT